MDGKKSIEDYILDMINQRYAKRVFSQLATEHERNFVDLGKDPDHKEYEWMVKRALEIHRALNIGGTDAVKETKD
jgi:succinate dehydrogenase flavin-adding protein (antitoxin of CptAB toxin-antitoxin module)